MTNLAELHLDEGRPDEALVLYQDSLAIQERAFGPRDSRLANTLRRYAGALRRAGQVEKATEVEKRLAGMGGG